LPGVSSLFQNNAALILKERTWTTRCSRPWSS
jgi:hypothetical protein